MEDLKAYISEFIKKEIINDEEVEIDPDENIIFTGMIDSMGIVRLINNLQNKYGVKSINNEDMVLDSFRSVSTIAATFSKYLN